MSRGRRNIDGRSDSFDVASLAPSGPEDRAGAWFGRLDRAERRAREFAPNTPRRFVPWPASTRSSPRQLFLRSEVVIGRSERELRGLGGVAHRGALQTAPPNDPRRHARQANLNVVQNAPRGEPSARRAPSSLRWARSRVPRGNCYYCAHAPRMRKWRILGLVSNRERRAARYKWHSTYPLTTTAGQCCGASP
jgi:hypothetical protein